VVIPARLRMGALWTDACILNISSRGLMIQATRAAAEGSMIELYRGDHVILARVVWRCGMKAGLQAEERIPVEEIMSLATAPNLQLTAGARPPGERRKRPRTHEQSRQRGKIFEFASVALIGASLAAGAYGMVEEAFARPLAVIEFALGGSAAQPASARSR
jgi:hypothetical protein